MEFKKVNEDVLCVLVHNSQSGRIQVSSVQIDKDLEFDFRKLITMLESDYYQTNNIVQYIMNHKNLNVLFADYNYCRHLSSPYQGLSTLETIQGIYCSNSTEVDMEKKKEEAKTKKMQLLLECRERLLAYYLEKTYNKCENDKAILAYSHRRVGWSAPKYALNENFSVELKTNFGYGSVSYFYSKIRYKGLDIVPFPDWVNYRYAFIYEIVQYSAKHKLTNESWLEAMEFISEACNMALNNEAGFIKKYIVDQCDEMVGGLEKILTDNSFKIKGYNFFNQTKGYIDLSLKGHNLIEFRGEKISGALQFIGAIRQFWHVVEISHFIRRLEDCNRKVVPMMVEEQEVLIDEIQKLGAQKDILEPVFKALSLKNTFYEQKKLLLRQELSKSVNPQVIFLFFNAEFDKEFAERNPDYDEFKKEFDKKSIEYHLLVSEIKRLGTIRENLSKYKSTIDDYFKKKG